MAKRTRKDPAPAETAQSTPFQIPEVSQLLPNPWEQIAAGYSPSIPTPGGITTGIAKPKAKPTLPDGTYDYDPDTLQRRRIDQLGPVVILERPARGRMSILGTDILGTCAMANELGTREPVKALISFSSDRKWGFIMPVHPTATKGVKITYQRKEAHINFWGAFQEFSRTVEKGFREYYQLEITDEPITIHGMKGYALFFSLEEYEKEPISERDETAESATTRVKVSGKSAKSGPTAKAGAESNKSGPESAATETTPATAPEPSAAPEAEEDNFALALQELNEMLDNREATIEELKARLKGYEEKFGQL